MDHELPIDTITLSVKRCGNMECIQAHADEYPYPGALGTTSHVDPDGHEYGMIYIYYVGDNGQLLFEGEQRIYAEQWLVTDLSGNPLGVFSDEGLHRLFDIGGNTDAYSRRCRLKR